jgi:hypothetical protein
MNFKNNYSNYNYFHKKLELKSLKICLFASIKAKNILFYK